MEFARIDDNSRIELDREMLRNSRAFDFHDPWNKAVNTVEGSVWDFFNNRAIGCGYKYREGQYDMAESVTEAIRGKHHLAVEAGVGIGKSFGYLVPALAFHKATRNPVIIATSTIALQEQLSSDLLELMSMMDAYEPFIVAKGQNNYLCIKRAKQYIDKWGGTRSSVFIEKGMRQGFYDKKDFAADLADKDWECVNVKEYSKKKCVLCEHALQCWYHRMRQELPKAGIVICNQDLLTYHLSNAHLYGTQLLNTHSALIVIDEAHNLEAKLRSANTEQIQARGLKELAEKAELSAPRVTHSNLSDELFYLYDAVDALFTNVKLQVIKQNRDELKVLANAMKAAGKHFTKNDLVNILEADKFFFEDVDGGYALLRAVITALDRLVEQHKAIYSFRSSQMEELAKIRDKLMMLNSDLQNYILWSERTRDGISLFYCPKDIASIGRRLFFNEANWTVLTSATMTGLGKGTNSERYAYCLEGIGFPAIGSKTKSTARPGELTTPIPSPFNYDEHAMIYYANDMPHPTKQHEAFLEAGIQRLKQILDISEGRALVLFTSKSDMRRVGKALKMMDLPYKVLTQTSGSSQKEVLEDFRKDEHAVLLGTGAYWEGISVEGDTLSNVVIFRLPFSVPDPITGAKEEGKKDPLMEVRVPEMIIKLKQGVGRLIRNEDDKGIISIIDSRLSDASSVPYKNQVWDALPIKNRTSYLDKIRKFYDTVVKETEGNVFSEAEPLETDDT